MRMSSSESPYHGFYGTNVHLVSYFEIALDLDPYLPEGESVHLLKNSRPLPYSNHT